MRLLAFDCACAACSVALLDSEQDTVLAARRQRVERGHATLLMPMIRDVLDDAGIGIGALDGLAVTVGPGGFTGVRIGLAAARGLALPRRLPVAGLTTLEVLAAAAPAGPDRVLAVVDSKRAEPFTQAFARPDSGPPTPLSRPLALAAEDLPTQLKALAAPDSPWRVTGRDDLVRAVLDGAGLTTVAAGGERDPEATLLARLAAADWRARATRGPGQPAPLYLRAPDVSRPTSKAPGS